MVDLYADLGGAELELASLRGGAVRHVDERLAFAKLGVEAHDLRNPIECGHASCSGRYC